MFPSDLVRTKNWGTEQLLDTDLEGQLDLIIAWIMAALDATTGHAHEGTSNKSPKVNVATGLTVTNQAQGDVVYAVSAAAFARLGAGTKGKCLTTGGAAANPTWEGMTTEGDTEHHDGTSRARLPKGTAYQIYRMNAGATVPEWASQGVIQVGNAEDGAMATGATAIPIDNSIPQNATDGYEFITLNFTPTNVNSILYIDVVFIGSYNNNAALAVALYKDATANALGSAMVIPAANATTTIAFRVKMTAGQTTQITFRVKVGGHAGGTVTFNGSGGTAYLGGNLKSSITVTEVGA